MTIEIYIKDLTKEERGTHSGPVQVVRGGKSHTRVQRLGKKPSNRKGTGKIDKFPDIIKETILDLRRQNRSGADIKKHVEDMIDHSDFLSTPETTKERRRLYDLSLTETDPTEKRKLQDKMLEIYENERTTYINDEPTGRNLVKEGLITEDTKLTVTPTGLTDWAAKQGVTTRKTRQTPAKAREEAEAKWKDDWKKVNDDKSKLEIDVKRLETEKASEQKQKQQYHEQLITCKNQLLQAKK